MREDCDKQCAEIASERIRYFTGRYMTARDFRDEQRYHQTHRYLHNRILHGWGVVCGLHVNPHPVEICRKDHVKVDCGMALDCCGHEILVRKPVVPPPIPWDQKPADHASEPPQPAGGGRGTGAPGDGRDAPANPTAARDSLAGARSAPSLGCERRRARAGRRRRLACGRLRGRAALCEPRGGHGREQFHDRGMREWRRPCARRDRPRGPVRGPQAAAAPAPGSR